jgi:hypothetical protein
MMGELFNNVMGPFQFYNRSPEVGDNGREKGRSEELG